MTGTAELVHHEEDITDVYADTSLEIRLKHHVTGHGLPVAIERKADELTLRIQYRAAGVTASDVIGGQEAGDDVVVFCIHAEILLLVQFLQFGWHLELIGIRILFLHDTGQSSIMSVEDSILRGIRLHCTVSQSHG